MIKTSKVKQKETRKAKLTKNDKTKKQRRTLKLPTKKVQKLIKEKRNNYLKSIKKYKGGYVKKVVSNKKKDAKKNVIVKSLPNSENEKLENIINICDNSIIKFYMESCPHCVMMKEAWNELCNSGKIKDFCDENGCSIGIIEVEVGDYTHPIHEKYIGKQQGVPHIISVDKHGNVKDIFNQDRTAENLISFAKK
jgi:hypothetical protein